VNRAFHRGQTVKIIQETTRLALEDMARELTLAGSKQVTICDNDSGSNCGGGFHRLCIGGVRYAWNEGIYEGSDTTPEQMNVGGMQNFYLVKETRGVTNCSSQINNSGDVTELIPERGAVLDIDVEPVNASGRVYRLSLTFSTRTKDLVYDPTDPATTCDPAKGTTYCDVVHLETAVSVR
jgi:hypothetical protein